MDANLHTFFDRIKKMDADQIEAEINSLDTDSALFLLNKSRERALETDDPRPDEELRAGIQLTRRLRSLRTTKTAAKKTSAPKKSAPAAIADFGALLK